MEQESDRVQNLREEYWEHIKHIEVNKLVFVDECGSKCVMTPRYGWGPKGERVSGILSSHWGKNITLIGAMGLDGVRTLMTVDGGTTGDVFYAFFKHLLMPTLHPGEVLVWDGLSSHKDARVMKLLEQAQVTLLPLPPYSPDLNPIESCGSKIKQWVRKLQPRTRETLDEAVGKAMDNVTARDASGWYAEIGYI